MNRIVIFILIVFIALLLIVFSAGEQMVSRRELMSAPKWNYIPPHVVAEAGGIPNVHSIQFIGLIPDSTLTFAEIEIYGPLKRNNSGFYDAPLQITDGIFSGPVLTDTMGLANLTDGNKNGNYTGQSGQVYQSERGAPARLRAVFSTPQTISKIRFYTRTDISGEKKFNVQLLNKNNVVLSNKNVTLQMIKNKTEHYYELTYFVPQ